MRGGVFAILSLVVAWFCAVADAQSDDPHDREAQALFSAGRVAYTEGRFDAAPARFEEAYELSHRPGLLYNIAQCHDRLRQDERAIEVFERYLRDVPATEHRVEVEGRLTALRAAVASRAVAPLRRPQRRPQDCTRSRGRGQELG
jgi:tetratricopeptide (TPR) repeat protein